MAETIRKRIMKSVVDAATPDPERRYIIWDTKLTGFGLLVLPSGARSYVMQYRTARGDSRRVTIGRHGDWTAEEARRKAEDFRDSLKQGSDPLAERRAAREALTVGDLLELYLQSSRFAEKAESTKAIDRGRIERHLRPLLGKRYVDDLTRDDVVKARNDIRDGKTAARVKTKARGLARVKGGETTARDTIGLLRAILNWAVAEDGIAVSRNPAESVKLGSSRKRSLILEDADDYARLFRTLDQMQNEKRIRAPVADAIRLIALVGCRRSEAAALRWRHVDLKAGRLVIPPAEHKTGGSTGEDRVISLPAAAQEIIARQPEGKPDDFVFAPSKGEGAANLSAPWRKVREEAKLPAGIGLHGLRHSVASHLAMGGAEAAQIMEAVGHRQISTTTRYIHFAKQKQAALAERAASVALAGLSASTGQDKAEVVEHPAGGKRAR